MDSSVYTGSSFIAQAILHVDSLPKKGQLEVLLVAGRGLCGLNLMEFVRFCAGTDGVSFIRAVLCINPEYQRRSLAEPSNTRKIRAQRRRGPGAVNSNRSFPWSPSHHRHCTSESQRAAEQLQRLAD